MKTRLISAITEFIFVSDPPHPADIIFIPGCPSPEVAERAAELYHAGLAPYILPAGKYGVVKGAFPGPFSKKEIYNKPYHTEWEFLADVLMRCGVPSRAILKEDQSGFTKENAILSRRVTDKAGIEVRKAIISCKSFHARRCLTYYQLAYPEARFFISPVNCYGISRENWFETEYGIERVMGELTRCGQQLAGELKSMKAQL
jgi:uncharacterized SAM-binding protein YcdF (DUF218 family)